MMSDDHPSVAIVGGGLAGLAAAEAAARCGLRVRLFEARAQLGGRAASFRDPRSGQWLDGCQHVALGCCTNLADFARRTGIDACFSRQRRLHFFGPDGTRSDVAAALLPAPLHLAPSFLRLKFLTLGQRLHILRTMGRLVRATTVSNAGPEATVGDWLRGQGESAAAIERFWSVILVSALGDLPDRLALSAASQVFREGFLSTRNAYELLLPTLPLAELYDARVGRHLAEQSVYVSRRTPIRQVLGNAGRATAVVLSDGSQQAFDFIVLAVPWHQAARLLAPELRAAVPALDAADRFAGMPISAVHLWFNRPICALPHAVLVDGPGQWLFQPAWLQAENTNQSPSEHYYQVVISASNRIEFGIDQIGAQLRRVWPAAAAARLIDARVLTYQSAVFSMAPGLDGLRPPQRTPVPNLVLAGDWTATGWPATMEGAVRSGYLAVETILATLNMGGTS